MQNPNRTLVGAAAVVLALGIMAVYLATMAPGLTWANGGSDGGDLITAARTGGVPHPTGYPVYLLLAGLFQSLPIGLLAFRTNVMSAVAATLAALLVYAILQRSLPDVPATSRVLAGLVGGLTFGLAPLAWSQAVITEVYTLHALFIGLLLYLCVSFKASSPSRSGWIGLIQGLAVGNHILAILMAPVVFPAIALGADPKGAAPARAWSGLRWRWRSFGAGLAGMVAGLLIYGILPLRAASHPPVNWGAPVTMPRLAWLVFGSLYQDSLLGLSSTDLWIRLRGWAALTVQQFGMIGLALALLGLLYYFSVSRIHLMTLWTAIVFTVFALQYDTVDSRAHLLAAYLAFPVWIGLAAGRLSHSASVLFRPAGWMIGVAILLSLVPSVIANWRWVDAAHDRRAEDFGRQLIDQAPPEALVFAEGDRAVFSAWYFHYGLQRRPDIAVIANSLLPFDWYRENLRYTYPTLEIPLSTPDVWIATIQRSNPGRAACFASAELASLSCQQGG